MLSSVFSSLKALLDSSRSCSCSCSCSATASTSASSSGFVGVGTRMTPSIARSPSSRKLWDSEASSSELSSTKLCSSSLGCSMMRLTSSQSTRRSRSSSTSSEPSSEESCSDARVDPLWSSSSARVVSRPGGHLVLRTLRKCSNPQLSLIDSFLGRSFGFSSSHHVSSPMAGYGPVRRRSTSFVSRLTYSSCFYKYED